MREIKFRAIPNLVDDDNLRMILEKMPKYDGTFIHGHLVDNYIVGDMVEADSEYTILEYWVPIKKETIGQYTGLRDKNDKEIYEGDIIRTPEFFNEKEPYLFNQVTFDRGVFALLDEDELPYVQYPLYDWIEKSEVIGNIYENPEMLGDE